MILKEALERAGAADRQKVNEALHALDMTTGRRCCSPAGTCNMTRGAADRREDGDGAVAERLGR